MPDWKPGDTVRFMHDRRGEAHYGKVTGPVKLNAFGSRRQSVFWNQTQTETDWDPLFYRDPDSPVEDDPTSFRSSGPMGETFHFTFVGYASLDGPPQYNIVKVSEATLTKEERQKLGKLRDRLR